MRQGSRIALLAVAFGAILTLILDYLEDFYRYIGARQRLSGQRPKPGRSNKDDNKDAKNDNQEQLKTDNSAVSRGVFFIKHLVGSVTLLTLVTVLAMLLFQMALHSQEGDYLSSYYGEWCGGDRLMSLSIKGTQSGEVHFAWGTTDPETDPQGWCDVEYFVAEQAQFLCENRTLYLTAKPKIIFGIFGSTNLPVEWNQGADDSGHQMLLPCNAYTFHSNPATLVRPEPFLSNH